MTYVASSPRERGGAVLLAAALTGVLGVLLASGLVERFVRSEAPALSAFDVTLPPPPVPEKRRVAEQHRKSPRREGEAAPPALRAEPTEIVAPLPAPTPPPIAAAPIAGIGAAPRAGSAQVPGPGTGAGGIGNGRGSGDAGDGDGGGGGDETPPRWVRGDLRDSDYPDAAADAGVGGSVGVRYLVDIDGRVRDCVVTELSGSRVLDQTTCQLIEKRFRYRPSRDGQGHPVRAYIVENHEWILRRDPAEQQPPPRRRPRIF
ncbi:energy transducer TonB [Sphingomonas sp. MMS12-HWE2-04]|uniref:energy transducer TonB n=1 Tax=Sphingomonas sp. MMS12-HWE2-04 TaxID=3234199 RepID=UPI0038511CB2